MSIIDGWEPRQTANERDVTLRLPGGATIRDDDSEDLVEVGTKVKELRDTAHAAAKSHARRVKEIENDPDLSDAGRQRLIQEEKDAHRASQKRLSAREVEIIKDKITALERRLDGYVGYGTSDLITFRDAQDRADAITTPEQAAKVMARALRNNDRTLAHAVFRRASENRWKDARDQFAAVKPDVARIVRDIEKLDALRTQWGRVLNYV